MSMYIIETTEAEYTAALNTLRAGLNSGPEALVVPYLELHAAFVTLIMSGRGKEGATTLGYGSLGVMQTAIDDLKD